MKCQLCGKNDASICMVKMVGNNKESMYICSECAKGMEHNLFEDVSNLFGPVFGNFFEGSMPLGSMGNLGLEEPTVCPTCGQTEGQWKESNKMGCRDCYQSFSLPASEQHIGKIPKENEQTLYVLNLINEKEGELQKLLADEAYEKAAVLRDEIKQLKEEMKDEI